VITIGVVEKNRGEYWDRLNRGLLGAAQRRGFRAEIAAPEYEDVDAQAALMRAHLERDVDALLFVATDPEAFRGIVDAALSDGVPVLTMDLDGYQDARLFHVGTAPFHVLGRQAADCLLPLLLNEGPVIAQAGSSAPGAAGKLAGFLDRMAEVGRDVIVLPPDHERLDDAERAIEAALDEHDDVAGLYGVYAYHPVLHARVLQRRGLGPGDVPVVGFDMLGATVQALRAGMISASIWIREHSIGAGAGVVSDLFATLSWDQAMTVLGGNLEDRAENIRRLPVAVFTPTNVDEYEAWLRANP
jgi:ribose transport system substrate-binding protein